MGFLDDIGFGNGVPDWASDILGGIKDVVTGQATQALGRKVGNFFTPSPAGPVFVAPSTPAVPTQQGPGSGLVPANPGSTGGERNYGTIRDKMTNHLGFAPRRRTVMMMLRRMGADFTAGALGLDQNDILWLYTHRRTSSRRHFLQTYLKWIRRAESAKRQLAPFARKVHAGGGHHRRTQKRAPPNIRIVKVPGK